MGRISRENNVLEAFFNEPSKHWHFTELKKKIKLAESKLDKWLKKFQKESLIIRVKKKGKMPYYVSNYKNPNYKYKKRIFAFNKLYNSGFLNHLYSLKVKGIILFGSFSRSDWYKESDIDVFIYGNPKGLNVGKYESELHRDIQVFIGRNKKEIKKFGTSLLRNIIKGNIIKGDLPSEVITDFRGT